MLIMVFPCNEVYVCINYNTYPRYKTQVISNNFQRVH